MCHGFSPSVVSSHLICDGRSIRFSAAPRLVRQLLDSLVYLPGRPLSVLLPVLGATLSFRVSMRTELISSLQSLFLPDLWVIPVRYVLGSPFSHLFSEWGFFFYFLLFSPAIERYSHIPKVTLVFLFWWNTAPLRLGRKFLSLSVLSGLRALPGF